MSQTEYQKWEFCLKQGRKISDFCLKQGQGMRGRAAPPHPGIYQVPPRATEVHQRGVFILGSVNFCEAFRQVSVI